MHMPMNKSYAFKGVHDLSVILTVVDNPLQNAFLLLLELETTSEEVTPQTTFGMILFSTLELYNLQLERVFKTLKLFQKCYLNILSMYF